MTLTIIEEADLRIRLSQHKAWLTTFNQSPSLVTGSQMRLVDNLISNVTLSNKDLSNAEIMGCRLVKTLFESCDLSSVDLISSSLVECAFINCCFVKADMRSVEGRDIDFSGSDFTRADLTDAVLNGANFTDCIFNWAWLIGTDLRRATLERVSFIGTRLSETKLSGDRKFELGSTERAVIDKVELSLTDNSVKIIGKEIFELLRRAQ
jgi:uncharacterized protein YjbI with pentapeptide repeats